MQLVELRSDGFFAGPDETEEIFQKRIDSCKGKKGGFLLTNTRFSFFPSWLEIKFSNRGLVPWVGAIAEIRMDGEYVLNAVIKLRTAFKKKEKLWGYTREELIEHEAVHASRLAFDEKKYEEVLAYQTSPKWLRRHLGGIFRTYSESLFFVLLTAACSLMPLLCFQFWPLGIPFIIFILFYLRLLNSLKTLKKCLRKIRGLFKVEEPLEIALHLTDREIKFFSKSSYNQINTYIYKQNSLRWRQILDCFVLSSSPFC